MEDFFPPTPRTKALSKSKKETLGFKDLTLTQSKTFNCCSKICLGSG